MFIAPYIFLITLLIVIPLVLSIKFEWNDAFIIIFVVLVIGGIGGSIASILTSINQTKHVKYKKVDVEIAKTHRMVFIDYGDGYSIGETVHDLRTINDSTIFYMEHRVNVWGYEYIEGPYYEIDK
jgi:hypothetical protein